MIDEKTFFNKVSVLVRGTLSASMISAVSVPLITRLYSAEQIGLLGLLMSLVIFWGSFQALRYDSAFFIVKANNEMGYIIVLCMACLLFTTILIIPVFYWLVSYNVLGFGLLPMKYIFATVIISFGFGGFLIFQNYNVRHSNFKLISKALIVRSLGNNVIKIGIGYFIFPNMLGLIIAEIVSAWATLNTLAFDAYKYLNVTFINFTIRKFVFVIKRYKVFPCVEMPSVIINKFNSIIPTPMIAFFFGPKEVGYFILALSIAGLPNTQVAKAVGDVFNMQFAEYVRLRNHIKARELFYATMRKLFLFGLLPLLGLLILAPYLAGPILGNDWNEVGYYMAYLSPWLFCALVVSPLSRILSIYKMVKYKLYYDLISLFLLILLFVFAMYFNLTVYEFLMGFVLVGILTYIIYGVILVRIIEKNVFQNKKE